MLVFLHPAFTVLTKTIVWISVSPLSSIWGHISLQTSLCGLPWFQSLHPQHSLIFFYVFSAWLLLTVAEALSQQWRHLDTPRKAWHDQGRCKKFLSEHITRVFSLLYRLSLGTPLSFRTQYFGIQLIWSAFPVICIWLALSNGMVSNLTPHPFLTCLLIN